MNLSELMERARTGLEKIMQAIELLSLYRDRTRSKRRNAHCDSIKRRLKADGGGAGLQGEFGIGLLSSPREVFQPEPTGRRTYRA
ncbi:MAG TPA: hypothetical protein VF387_01235 [Gemmatimonadaceae bacterium]